MSRRIALSGSRGLVGSALSGSLEQGGNRVLRLVRRDPGSGEVAWDPDSRTIDPAGIEGLDAVVHLAGENIAARRWTARQKERIRRSRVEGTRLIAETLAGLERPPGVLVSASAIGFYGNRGDEELDEDSPAGTGFLAETCAAWEAATGPALAAGIRVVPLRIGIVLSPDGGALQRMLPLFRLGLGGRLGNGRQYMSWIALPDLVAVVEHVLADASLVGPVNAVSAQPVRNAEFTRVLGRVLRRPAVLPAPAPILRVVLGEMGQELLLDGARVLPRRLQRAGFSFRLETLERALHSLLC